MTVIGARNMWLNAQEKVKVLLNEANAKIVGNIALTDQNPNMISAITVQYWMFTGKKDRWLGLFPEPGIANREIERAATYGEVVSCHLDALSFDELQTELVQKGAVEVKTNLMFIEQRAGRLFSIWANFISKKENKTVWLKVFKYYLLFALFLVAPVVLLINTIFFRPFSGQQIEQKKRYYSGVA